MKSIVFIGIIIGISLVTVFVIGEVIWYFAGEEFEKARDEFRESLTSPFEKQHNYAELESLGFANSQDLYLEKMNVEGILKFIILVENS